MTDPLAFEEPNAKRQKLSANEDFGWRFTGGADELPDELLDTGPSTSADVVHDSSDNQAPTFRGVPNNAVSSNALTSPPFGNDIGQNFIGNQSRVPIDQQRYNHLPVSSSNDPNATNVAAPQSTFNSGSGSVLEELLLMNKPSTGPTSTSGQFGATAVTNQRPPGIGSMNVGMPNFTNRSVTVNQPVPISRMGSASSIHLAPRSMVTVSSSDSFPGMGAVGHPLPGHMMQYRQSVSHQDQLINSPNAGRFTVMNGQKIVHGGMPNSFVRMERTPSVSSMMTMDVGMVSPSYQQRLPMQQQPIVSMPQVHQPRMNPPSQSNHQIGSINQPFPQDLHLSQTQPPQFQMVNTSVRHQQLPPTMNVGMRQNNPHLDLNMSQPRFAGPFLSPSGAQTNDAMQFPPSKSMIRTHMVHPNASLDLQNSPLPDGTSMPLSVPPSSSSFPSFMSPYGSDSGISSNGQALSNEPIGNILPTSGASQDPEKRKLIQQQLVLLLHALKCQQREKSADQPPCKLPHCGTMKGVLMHMSECRDGRSCIVPHCASSRQILAHWRSCNRSDCPVCTPLKQITDRSGRVNGTIPMTPMSNGHASLENRYDADGIGRNSSDALENPKSESDALDQSSLIGSVLLSQDSNDNRGSSITPKLPAPETAAVQKEWHRQVTLDLRNHLISKLIKAIFPLPDPSAMQDQRIHELMQYARKVEKEMFETASDREEYYHLLAEKIYKIQKELIEKKQRLDQSQGRHPSFGQDPSPSGQLSTFSTLNNEICGSQVTMNGSVTPSLASNVKLETSDISESGFTSATTKMDQAQSSFHIAKKESSQNICMDEKSSTSSGTAVKSVAAVRKEFTTEELCKVLLPLLETLEPMDDAIPFLVPVDPIKLQIPDYFDVIKNPMDLSTIRAKLLDGVYKNPWQFCDDMWLMFDNAWSYNRKASKVYKCCTKLSETFVDLIDPIMASLGYCCGRKLSFTPLALVCYGQNTSVCSIPRDAIYYCYEDNRSQYGVGSSERYTYCKKCFDDVPGDTVNLGYDQTSPDNLIPKRNFKQLKNDQIEYEPFVDCVDCGRKWHKICALHVEQIFPGGFVCETCIKQRGKPKIENRFTAKRLPHCKLSQHLEKRVNEFLRKRLASEMPAGEVIIRVLSSSDKEVETKPKIKAKYGSTGEIGDKFPYRAKAIFAFEVIDGVEVCFFGLHVQEYGSNCPPPNQRRVYIAYLDSVHFFTPKHVRTQVYHEILLGYLEYVKRLGYTMAHIWACPPSEGDDYVFHCHPVEQKIPKPKRLQEWYKKLLDKGIVERVVTDYKDIYDFYLKEEPLTSAAELPLFEGDYWPNIIEESLKEVEAEEAERRREAEASAIAAASGSADDGEDDTDEIILSGKKRGVQGNKKSKSKTKGASSKKNKKAGGNSGNDLVDKLMVALEKHKEVFFVVRLYSKQSASALPAIVDPDSHITCDFMDGRDTFLSTARDRHWEFSSLRRAKYSTLALCYELHTQGSDGYTCDTCKNTNATWHCPQCEDFDLCQDCYEKSNHEHKMEKIKSLVADDGGSTQDGQSLQNPSNRKEMIEKCIQTLIHASICRDANCRKVSCQKMKRVVLHMKTCKNLHGGNAGNSCGVCRQLLSLCLFHARHCQDNACLVPMCHNIRQKLAERQAQLRKKRDREMMRRINIMSNQNAIPSSVAGPETPYQQTMSPIPSMNVGTAQNMIGNVAQFYQSGQQMAINPAAVRAAKDIEKIAQQQVLGSGGMGTYQQRPLMGTVRQPLPNANYGAPTGGAPVPPNQLQYPAWNNGGYQSHGPMVSQPGVAQNLHVAPEQRTLNQAQLSQQVHLVIQRLRNATTSEERDSIMKALRSEPQVFSAILRLKQNPPNQQQQHLQAQQQQPQPTFQQQQWGNAVQQQRGPPPAYFSPRTNSAPGIGGHVRYPATPGLYESQPMLQQDMNPQMANHLGNPSTNTTPQDSHHFMQR